jgi:hypothetical protein
MPSAAGSRIVAMPEIAASVDRSRAAIACRLVEPPIP